MFFFGPGKGGGKGPAGFPAGLFGHGGDDDDEDEEAEAGAEVDNSKLYETLGVSKDATAADIKKAYRKLAMQHHPDKGGDPETFKDIQKAFEVLGDPEKRERYDQRGEAGLDGSSPGSPQDLLSHLFGKGGGKGRAGRPRTQNVMRPLWLSLEELYAGSTRALPISRKVVDEGAGAGPCQECNGQGTVTQVIRMGPMIQQMRQPCSDCGGSGSTAKRKTVREVLEVFVEKGAPADHKIHLHGKADEAPGHEPGDVVVIVKEKDHPTFMRKGADLYMEKEVTIAEALTGFRTVVRHLDGRRLLIRTQPGEVIRPRKGGLVLKAVAGAGMPIHKDPFKYGNLFLVLSIRFPAAVDPAAAGELRRLLGAPPLGAEEDEEDCDEEAALEDIDPLESSKQGVKAGGEAYEEDEHEGMPVQCQQQ